MSIQIELQGCKFKIGDNIFTNKRFFFHGKVTGGFFGPDGFQYVCRTNGGVTIFMFEDELWHAKPTIILSVGGKGGISP